jgi:two-component system, chemotaxis family, chemotaxis protein CheY
MTLTLLAVDDDASSAELIVRIAERCGFEAFATSDPRGVIELVRQLNPSVMAIDVNMPNIDANGLLKLLSESGFKGHIMIVSGQDMDTLKAVAAVAVGLGLNQPDVIQKPIDLMKMRSILGAIWKANAQPTPN